MKNKIKLTDLSHLEPLNDEMAYLKGGEENGPFCSGCKCVCQCVNDKDADTNGNNNRNSARSNGGESNGWDGVIGIATILIAIRSIL